MAIYCKSIQDGFRSILLTACTLGALGSMGCSAPVGGEADVESIEADLTWGRSLPWRGGAQSSVRSSIRSGQVDTVYGVEIGNSTICAGVNCRKLVVGLRVFSYHWEDASWYGGQLGQTQADKWTWQQCPAEAPWVEGYRINVGSVWGVTSIKGLGLTCGSNTGNKVFLPIVGDNTPLFPETLDCRPFTNDPISFVGNIRMNDNGRGMAADCNLP